VTLICLLPIALAIPFLNEPFERDEGTYATIAQGVLRGELPYRDYFDHKPPLIYLWYALSFVLFGESIIAPRIAASLVWSGTTVIVYLVAAQIFSARAGMTAALLFALSSGVVMLQANANTEVFMILPATLCLYSATRVLQGAGGWWLLALGVAGGLSVLTKQVAFVGVMAAAGFVVVHAFRVDGARHAARAAAIISFGALVVTGIVLAPFILRGAFDDFMYATWTYNRVYALQIPLENRIRFEIDGMKFFVIVAAPFALLGTVGLIRAAWLGRRKDVTLLMIWIGAAYAGVVLSGRAFPHYYVGLLPALAVLGGHGIPDASIARRLMLPVLCVAILVSALLNTTVYSQPTPEAKHTARFPNVQPEMQNASRAVALRIAELTSPDEAIFEYGRETQLYFYAARRPAARFIYDRPFVLDPPTLEETMLDLAEDPPALIIDTASARDLALGRQPSLPAAVRAFLAAEYEFVERLEFADIYRLKR
jgi:4-amino-4-deoxy-L-arabinose transferase-like glycosyltransferase